MSAAPARLDETRANLDGPQRFKVQFTACEDYVSLVEEAKALLAHALPGADLAEIHLRAMQALVAQLKKRKFAAPARGSKAPLELESPEVPTLPPKTGPSSETAAPESPRQRGRRPSASVRRAVFERDGNRCAYVDLRGERCRETSRLEFHHHDPFARGGPATLENLSLYCAAHNALAAEQDFGREHAAAKRGEHGHFTERTVCRLGRKGNVRFSALGEQHLSTQLTFPPRASNPPFEVALCQPPRDEREVQRSHSNPR